MNDYVPGEGKKNARIVIVGEAPGRTEVAQGRPFVGGSGQLLNDMLMRVGISREDECYLTNVMKVRPQSNYFGEFYHDPSTRKSPRPQLKTGIRLLHEEIKAIKPNVIIALGAEALRALTGKRKITNWRGSILSSPCGKTIATYHPASILRLYEHRAIAELDLKRAQEESHSPDIILPKHNFLIDPSFEMVMDWLSTFIANPQKLAGDIETTTTHVRCLSLADSPNTAICIPFISNQHNISPGRTVLLAPRDRGATLNSHWSEVEELAILDRLHRVFQKCPMIFQNFPFDATILLRDLGLSIKTLFMDTMVAQHTCYSELPKSLNFLCSVYTRQPRYSDYDVSSDLSTWTYNCFDSSVDFGVSDALIVELKERKLWKFYTEIAQPVMVALCRLSNTGIGINHELQAKTLEAERTHLKEIEAKIVETVGYTVNPNSPKQMQALLYDKWKLPAQRSRKGSSKGNLTTDEDAIDALALKAPQHKPAFDAFLDYRGTVKLIGTYLTCQLDLRQRMVTSYHATGTVEGRISSSKTIFDEGGNLQNIPRGKFRRMYVPTKPNLILIKADLSQAEMRVVAWVARIWQLIEKFQDPLFDVHRWNATLIYGGLLEAITKHQRQQAKHCLHSANYRGGPATAVKHAKIPYREAKHALDAYASALPELVVWWQLIEDTVSSSRLLRTPLGRERVFLGRLNLETFRSATAFIPAGTVGDQVNRALVNITRELDEMDTGARVLLQVHDELVTECPDDPEIIDATCKVIKTHMEEVIPVEGVEQPLVIPCELKTGPNWYDLKEYPCVKTA